MFSRGFFVSNLLGIVGSTSFAIAVGACGAGAGAGAAESNVTIDPSGSDKPGKLLVTLPPGQSEPQDKKSKFVASINDSQTDLTIGQPLDLPVGKLCLQDVEPRFEHGVADGLSADCTLTITSGNTTTYPLGIVAYQHTLPTIGLDRLDMPKAIEKPIMATPQATNIRVDAVYEDRLTDHAARLPGTYIYTFGLFDGIEQALPGGAVTTVNLDDFSNRRAASIVAPTRGLLSVIPSNTDGRQSVTPDPPTYSVTGSSNGYKSTMDFELRDGKSAILGEIATIDGAPANVGSSYTLTLGDPLLTMPIALSAKAGDPPTPNAVQRIDVNDVAEKQNDGSTVRVSGTWILEKSASDGHGGTTFQRVYAGFKPFSTGSGIDVVPGTYRITTTYTTTEAGQKTTTNVVTVP